jgi:hypothetical protein
MIKVKDTKVHTTSSSYEAHVGITHTMTVDVVVAEGKWVLILDNNGFSTIGGELAFNTHTNKYVISVGEFNWIKSVKPIIISETEKIEVGDWVLYSTSVHKVLDINNAGYLVRMLDGEFRLSKGSCNKILALPEQISPKHLQDIVDGKIKDGDKVLVECEYKVTAWSDTIDERGKKVTQRYLINVIKLNSQSHVTLHKVEEKMVPLSLLEKAFEAGRRITEENTFRDGDFDSTQYRKDKEEWFEQNIK